MTVPGRSEPSFQAESDGALSVYQGNEHPLRTALITGASRGIGRGIAFELARQGFGLTISSRRIEDLDSLAHQLEDAGAPEVVRCAVDLAEVQQTRRLVLVHTSAFGAMDVLVLSGGVGTNSRVADLSEHRLRKTLDVNLTSSFLLTQQCLPLLRKASSRWTSGSRVILLSSITGLFTEPGLAAYGASKAGLISLAETLNAEESANGVMATAIAPGYVDTDMAAWTTDTIPVESMIRVDDVVAVVQMILRLGRAASITRVAMTRSGTRGLSA